METEAAILWETNTPWSVEDIVIDPPKAGEVVVKLAASGLCHSDEHIVTGDMALPPEIIEQTGASITPIIGGHEGAGEVVEVGPGVTSVQPGDHVSLSFVPSCGRCPSCAAGRQNLCDMGAFLLFGRQISDLTARHHAKSNGADLGLMCCLGTFSPYTLVNEASCVKLDDDIPLDKAALVGCGVTTGWGSAVYLAEVKPGETVVVIGVGGIGINAIQGAVMSGARHIVAVDPVQFKRDESLKFGATHTAASVEEALELVGMITWGAQADKVIITTGVADGKMILPVMTMVAKGGRCVVTSVASMASNDVSLNLADFTLMQKQLVGGIFGGANPRRDIPRLLRLYKEGKLKLDELITTTYKLSEVNQGYQDMRDGKNLRGLIRY
ncbi:NDMA-dependent alcohol dehydrogenase [Actinocorallia aurantiaca]|uniref:NDMA-dependent alcohol dehydrogenase n=1 Tax=Actinocorallia aurantiaca TaxID=46204 RepID=A0ABN3TW24_9ACTN